jgi:hypothetical protein
LQTQKTFRFISAILFKQNSKGIKTALKLSQSNLLVILAVQTNALRMRQRPFCGA